MYPYEPLEVTISPLLINDSSFLFCIHLLLGVIEINVVFGPYINAPKLLDSTVLSTDIAEYQSALPDAKQLADCYLFNLENLYQIWQECGPAPLLARWQDK